MTLFEKCPDNADLAYRNIREGEKGPEREIRAALEAMWLDYAPYADSDFLTAFAIRPDDRFWEMQLTLELLAGGKQLRLRSELPRKQRDKGPDICVEEVGGRVWIEAVTPGPGDTDKPDRVPDLVPLSEGGSAQPVARREAQLRITTVLDKKLEKFSEYREDGIVSAQDVCLVAICGAKFGPHAWSSGLSSAARAVYPLGELYAEFHRDRPGVVGSGYYHSEEIPRSGKNDGISRSAFLSDDYKGISGLIWSRIGMGSFLWRKQDYELIHNVTATHPLPRGWFSWASETVVEEAGDHYTITTHSSDQ